MELFPSSRRRLTQGSKFLPGTGRGTMQSMVEGAVPRQRPLRQRFALPPPVPGRIVAHHAFRATFATFA
jgi:hypothetical protein